MGADATSLCQRMIVGLLCRLVSRLAVWRFQRLLPGSGGGSPGLGDGQLRIGRHRCSVARLSRGCVGECYGHPHLPGSTTWGADGCCCSTSRADVSACACHLSGYARKTPTEASRSRWRRLGLGACRRRERRPITSPQDAVAAARRDLAAERQMELMEMASAVRPWVAHGRCRCAPMSVSRDGCRTRSESLPLLRTSSLYGLPRHRIRVRARQYTSAVSRSTPAAGQ